MTKRKEQQPKYKQSETVVIKRSQINFAPYNPRKEDPEVIKKLKKNFKTVGYLGGIVWNQLSSYLVSGHKRVQTLDIINNYDGTPETDYEIKVEAVELDDKTEREQNIFMNSPSAMGEFDMEKIKVLVPEIDYKAAGLSEADMNIYGISSFGRMDNLYNVRFDKMLQNSYLNGEYGATPIFETEEEINKLFSSLK